MINNLLASYFTPSQTATIIVVAVVGVLLIVLNIVLAYVFNKRGERKLYDLLLQQQRELLMKQLEEMRSGEITFEDPDAEQLTMQDFFVRSAPEKASAETVAEEQVITEEPIRESEKVEEIEESEEIEEIPPEELIDEEAESVEEIVINGLVVRYNRSFTARIIQASDEIKSRYSELKNYILSYKGVKNRISWKRESFRIGRNTFACFVMRGKTLCLCLATDPARFADTKYKVIDLSVRSPKNKMPSMYRILNDRRVKYAKEIIDMLMAELGLLRAESYIEDDFALPYQSTQELIDLGLIKVVGEEMPQLKETAAAAEEQVITEEPVQESEKVEEIEESEEIEEIPPEELIDEEAESVEEIVINGLVVRYNRSFTARLTQASDEMKSRYSEIKNYILSYKGVKNRISWKRETFRIGRNTFACFVMRGKTLCLCLATDPARFEETKYKIFDLSVRSPKNKMPSMYRILNDRRVKYAKEIIDMLMAELGLNRNEAYADEDFMLSYRTTEELIDCDLIKIIGQNTTVSQEVAAVRDVVTEAEPEAIEEPVETVEAEPEAIEEPVETVEAEPEAIEEPVETAEAKPEAIEEPVETVEAEPEAIEEPVETVEAEPEVNEEPVGTAEAEPEAIEEPVETAEAEPEVNEEPVEEVEEDEGISVQDASDKMSDEEAKASVEVEIITKPVRKGGKSAIVNIQSLSKNYSAGDVVNLESLREKNLIAKNVVYVKILAKGSLNKALTVEADDFSLEAVKMIVLTGGRAIRTKNGC